MPVVSISTERLQALVGKQMTRDELAQALRSLGSDVEGYALLTRYRCNRCGQRLEALEHEDFRNTCDTCGSRDVVATGSGDVVRIKLEPVRPDLFDPAGLSRALRGKLDIETGLAEFRFGRSGYSIRVQPGLERIRPHIVGCVVRGIVLNDELVKTLMKMQENLHWALGRDRRRASIGVYDLDRVEPDFEYRPVGPEELEFVPLFGMPEGMVAATPKAILERHPKGVGYAHLLAGFARYPLLSDAKGQVLSMPPIINSEVTRVTESSKNLFVDVTGPDKNVITKALGVIAAALDDIGGRVETIDVAYPDRRSETTPDMDPSQMELVPAEACRVLGFELGVEEMVECLRRMRHGCRYQGEKIVVDIAAYRSDVMHPWDLIEDVGIGYGYEHIRPRLVRTMTVARPRPIEELSSICRQALTGLGFLETMTLLLTNQDEHLVKLGLADDGQYALIENPASVEQTIVRRHLLSGLLATLRVNATREMPQQIFEIGDCFELAADSSTGVRSRRRVGAGCAGPKAGFAAARAVAEALTSELGLTLALEPRAHPAFIPGRAARFMAHEADLGILGEVHPEVLERFGISQPAAVFEFGLDRLE